MYLPYVCILRAPSISDVFRLYEKTLIDLQKWPVDTITEEKEFQLLIARIYEDHKDVLRLMQRGYAELDAVCGDDPRLNKDDLSSFLNRFMTTRIGNRVLVKHYLNLSNYFPQTDPNYIGVVKTNCRIKDIVQEATKPLVHLIYKTYEVL